MPERRRPKLGQHFLTDSNHRRRILNALELDPGELVVEIGAGRGAMTELLRARAPRIIALELDGVLAEKLKKKFETTPGVEILRADVLSTDLGALCRRWEAERCFVFGNLPYYITSPILHHLFHFRACVRAMALLVQREVAQRLTAEPGTRPYGYLSVLAQFYSQPRIVLSVPPGAFSPAPKVHSALVDFQMNSELLAMKRAPGRATLAPSVISPTPDEGNFLGFVKRCFAQKRKKLLNNLKGSYSGELLVGELAHLGLPPTVRAEQLTLGQFVHLYRSLARRNGWSPAFSPPKCANP